jgi:hypothetical protein
MAKNLLHCETGFGVYRSTQLGHIPFFLLLYLLVCPSISENPSLNIVVVKERRNISVCQLNHYSHGFYLIFFFDCTVFSSALHGYFQPASRETINQILKKKIRKHELLKSNGKSTRVFKQGLC